MTVLNILTIELNCWYIKIGLWPLTVQKTTHYLLKCCTKILLTLNVRSHITLFPTLLSTQSLDWLLNSDSAKPCSAFHADAKGKYEKAEATETSYTPKAKKKHHSLVFLLWFCWHFLAVSILVEYICDKCFSVLFWNTSALLWNFYFLKVNLVLMKWTVYRIPRDWIPLSIFSFFSLGEAHIPLWRASV